MKTTLIVVSTASFISTLAAASNITSGGNATASNVMMTGNATKIGTLGDDYYACKPDETMPTVASWYYNSRADGPYRCYDEYSDSGWGMLNAYRSGGAENVHWKYTNDENDKECLKDWTYYKSDGQTPIIKISGRTTLVNESRRWCALPVYRTGGVEGKQWAPCWCDWSR